MKIIKKGKVVTFECQSCGGKFIVGFLSVKESGENYYVSCPMCGNKCHADATDVQEYEEQSSGTHEKHGAK